MLYYRTILYWILIYSYNRLRFSFFEFKKVAVTSCSFTGPQVYIYKKRRYYGGKPAYRKKKDLKILKKKNHDPIYNDSDIQSLVICLIDKYTQKIEDTMIK
ncbi:unnamed protein product [Rhizophagus irregularis]|nr:unnamed protein product [Rhizophagus irregularis]CAB5308494.1 unnamed protein product [Rhizophagus irregularis]